MRSLTTVREIEDGPFCVVGNRAGGCCDTRIARILRTGGLGLSHISIVIVRQKGSRKYNRERFTSATAIYSFVYPIIADHVPFENFFGSSESFRCRRPNSSPAGRREYYYRSQELARSYKRKI